MSLDELDNHWDFTPVIGLIHTFSTPGSNSRQPYPTVKEFEPPLTRNDLSNDKDSALGNFDRIWNALGSPLIVPPPDVTSLSSVQAEDKASLHDLAGPEADTTLFKGVRWRDENGLADLEDSDANLVGPKAGLYPDRKVARSPLHAYTGTKHDPKCSAETSSLVITEKRVKEGPDLLSLEDSSRQGEAKRRGPLALLPSTVYASASISLPKSSILKPRALWPVPATILSTPSSYNIEPLVVQSAAERKAKLLVKLVEDFPEDRRQLSNLARTRTLRPMESSTSSEIHVFVDCSNIMIGFLDTLKQVRGIPEGAHPRRAPMSFHSLALILERGRQARKRVLAGSKPLTAAIKEAQECGYETNILDRVMKAREVTPRKVRRHSTNGNTTSGPSSGSETTGPRRLVEQAVDEILHLKMMESLLDVPTPAIIVLATGDAAEAEYSAGFMKMVERALEKGWKVELANFSRNCSFAYRKKSFRQKWKGSFRLVVLDDYCEELLDM